MWGKFILIASPVFWGCTFGWCIRVINFEKKDDTLTAIAVISAIFIILYCLTLLHMKEMFYWVMYMVPALTLATKLSKDGLKYNVNGKGEDGTESFESDETITTTINSSLN